MSLEPQVDELKRLGFDIAETSEHEVIAIKKQWHWDCIFTKLTYVVVARHVDELTASMIDEDRESLAAKAKQLDNSLLPRGFQKGVAVIVAYLARQVTEEARERCESKPPMRFAWFHVPSARDTTAKLNYFVRKTPAWGGLYYGKFRHLIQRVLEPSQPATNAPLSKMGIGLLALMAFSIVLPLLLMLGMS